MTLWHKTFSTSLAFCGGIQRIYAGFSLQWTVIRSSDFVWCSFEQAVERTYDFLTFIYVATVMVMYYTKKNPQTKKQK